MEDVLKVSSAIRLLSTDFSHEVEELKQAVKTIDRVNKEKVSINSALKSSFSSVTKAFKERNIAFKGLFLDCKELEEYLATLDAEINDLEREKVEYQQKQASYSKGFDTGYGQTYFDGAGVKELEDNNKKYAELNATIEEKKKDYAELTQTVENMKKSTEEEKFEYFVKMYATHKDEVLDKINEIDEVVVRVNLKKEFESIEDLIAGKIENDKKQEESYAIIDEVSKKLGVPLVYEKGKKNRVTKKEEVIAGKINGDIPEQTVIPEFKPLFEPIKNEKQEEKSENPFMGFNPAAAENNTPTKINNISDLVIEIKKLNPDKNIEFTKENGAALNIDFPVQFLVLPVEQDFCYVEGIGITNKKDDRIPYIVLPVNEVRNKEIPEENDVHIIEPVVSEIAGDIPIVEVTPVEETYAPVQGKRYKVKKVASAIIDQHAKAIFHGAAISSITLGFAGLSLAPGGVLLAATAGFVGGGLLSETIDKLYRKIAGNSGEKIDELENIDKSGDLTPEKTNKLLAGLKKLSKLYPKIKRGKHEKRRWADELNNIDENDLFNDDLVAGRGV